MKKARINSCLTLAALLAVALWLTGCQKEPAEAPLPSNPLIVGYAEGVTVVEDPDAFSKVLDKAYADSQEPGVSLEYKSVAYSKNGTDFSCYLANAAQNQYDMFIAVYNGQDLSDELFLSGLLRPGTAFDHITLNRALPLGQNNCTVAFTQIEEVDGQQMIREQALIGVEFYVIR